MRFSHMDGDPCVACYLRGLGRAMIGGPLYTLRALISKLYLRPYDLSSSRTSRTFARRYNGETGL